MRRKEFLSGDKQNSLSLALLDSSLKEGAERAAKVSRVMFKEAV